MKATEDPKLIETLSLLYADASKHSVYQSVPGFVADAIGYQVEIDEDWRGDRVRLDFIEAQLGHLKLPHWCDFGANTGYFSLTMAHLHPERQVLAIEANPNHAQFIASIRDAFGMNNVTVRSEAVTLESLSAIRGQDVMLHLNVLHHAGMDFDRGLVTSAADFPAYAIKYLQRLRGSTRWLAFQLGSNLWGDKAVPLIDHRADTAKLKLFAGWISQSGWRIHDIAYATKDDDGKVTYASLERDMTRRLNEDPDHVASVALDSALAVFDLHVHPGEFYRRPLFICSDLFDSV